MVDDLENAIQVAKWLAHTRAYLDRNTGHRADRPSDLLSSTDTPEARRCLKKNGFTWSENCRHSITEGEFAIRPTTTSEETWHLVAWQRTTCTEWQEVHFGNSHFLLARFSSLHSWAADQCGQETVSASPDDHRGSRTTRFQYHSQPRRSTMTKADIVVFRRWRDTGDVIAFFPELPADLSGDCCDAYERVGQHGGADYHGVIQHTTPCSLNDAAALAARATDHRLQTTTDQAGRSCASRSTTTTCSGPPQHDVNQPYGAKDHDRNHDTQVRLRSSIGHARSDGSIREEWTEALRVRAKAHQWRLGRRPVRRGPPVERPELDRWFSVSSRPTSSRTGPRSG